MPNPFTYVVWNPDGSIIESNDAFDVLLNPVVGSYCMSEHFDAFKQVYYYLWFKHINDPYPRFNPIHISNVEPEVKTLFLLRGLSIWT